MSKYAIAKGSFLMTEPSENCRNPRHGERRVKCVYASQSQNPILKREVGYKLVELSHTKATYRMTHADTNLDEAKSGARELADQICQEVRESGFISTITGEWTGVTSKENITRAKPVSQSARNGVAEGRPDTARQFKLATTKKFITLTNTDIVSIDDEINGDTGFIQQCYDRESAIVAVVDFVSTTPSAVNTLYQDEIEQGWPTHGQV